MATSSFSVVVYRTVCRNQFATLKRNRFVVLTYHCSKLIVANVRVYFEQAQEVCVHKKRFPADYLLHRLDDFIVFFPFIPTALLCL